MNVPLLDLNRQHQPLHDEIVQAMSRVVESNAFILGPEVTKLEGQVAEYCETRFAIGVSSGTDALLVSLMAIGLGPGDEVITTPYTFFATVGSITRLGAKPVFVDIDPVTYNIDPAKIEEKITPRTKAIIPVHLYGQCADSEALLSLAEKHDLYVIEDAAQAIGAQYSDGRKAGNMGDLGCFSFFPTKNLGCFGDGGMVVTNHSEMNDRVRMLRVHGSQPKYYHQLVGGNFRLDALQAAVLNVKFPHLEGWNQKRRQNALRYDTLFKENGLTETQEVQCPEAVYADSGVLNHHTYNQYVIRVADRDALREYLSERGVATEVYYPLPLHLQQCFLYLGHKEGSFPESERAAKSTLALPIYPGLEPEQQAYVVQQIQSFFKR
ncbi:MAG: DegT/DnrJ/EryC1/StrS family aminotransferase [Nitrospinae bacterium]|jgi:dTDP-4-amino-4,6-dideoxygalactose transaminase|nr:DegT/DnrJ/EryC1/StrS family aminotransferase [Nitrospinota bacterium]MDA1109713.1 DegT/DnrJ/EryC1/StrS family aminotransferase [Nitrospinota bacterium]